MSLTQYNSPKQGWGPYTDVDAFEDSLVFDARANEDGLSPALLVDIMEHNEV